MDSVQNVGLTAGYRPDASIKNILLSLFYFPPSNRTASEIAPGFSFYYEEYRYH